MDGVGKKKRNGGCILLAVIGVIMLIVSICLLCFGVATLVASADSGYSQNKLYEGKDENKLAVIDISGAISQQQSATVFDSTGLVTSTSVTGQLDAALNDDSVKAVLLRIESPGGEVPASDIIFRKVMEVREKKPVVAYSSSMAASGGYYIASGADEFIVHQSSITGSIGVILQTNSLAGLYEKLGIETKTFKSDDLKDDQTLYDADPNGEIEQVFQGLVDESYEQFLDAIVEGRGMDRTQLRELADGRIYTGKQAVDNGLADSLGYEEDAIAKAEELAGQDDLTIIQYQESSFLDLIFGSAMRSMFKAEKFIDPAGVKAYYLLSL